MENNGNEVATMISCEEELLNNVMFKIQLYIDQDNLSNIKNAIASEINKYDFSTKDTSIVVYDNHNQHLLDLFLSTKLVEGKSTKTIDRYRHTLNKFFDFLGNKPVKDITANDIRFFLAEYHGIPGRKNSNTTMDGMRRVISSFFNWLDIEEYVDRNYAKKVTMIKHDTQKERPYTTGEMEAMMLFASTIREKTILEFMYSTACRVSELCQVDIDDVDFINKRVLLHGKGGKDRTVPIDDKLLFYLQEYFKYRIAKGIDNISLFTSSKKPFQRMTANGIRVMINKIANKAGVKHAHPHRYRVTRITILLKRGMKLEEVQVIAGHADINTTAYYNRSDNTLIEAEFFRKS